MSSRSGSGSLNAAPQGQSSQAGSRRGSPPDAASFGLDVHNLLGPTVANAFKLHDEKDRLGIFFVFQDLSVRTEGTLASYMYESGQSLWQVFVRNPLMISLGIILRGAFVTPAPL